MCMPQHVAHACILVIYIYTSCVCHKHVAHACILVIYIYIHHVLCQHIGPCMYTSNIIYIYIHHVYANT